MKEEGQKRLEVELQKSIKNIVTSLQKAIRGWLARRYFKKMLAAKETMYKGFLFIVDRRKFRKDMKEKRKKIKEAAKKI